MKKKLILLFTILLGGSAFSQGLENYPDPQRFEKAIEAFEAENRTNPAPRGAVLCIGSSSMRMWHGTIVEDLAPLTLIRRGFGGSNMNDVLHYADRIVLPYKPRAIVLYEGDNDIAQGVSPETIQKTFRVFTAKVHAELPECRFYVLSIKPSISRWNMWPDMQAANRLMAADCAKDERMVFVDAGTPMLGDDGLPKPEIFKKDNLHMKRIGYEIWCDALKPVLHKTELQYESKAGQPGN